MNHVAIILRKELLELRQQRGLLLGIAVIPVVATLAVIQGLYAAGQSLPKGSSLPTSAAAANPALAGMTSPQSAQALFGQTPAAVFLLLPLITSYPGF